MSRRISRVQSLLLVAMCGIAFDPCVAQETRRASHVFVQAEASAFSMAPEVEELALLWDKSITTPHAVAEVALGKAKRFGSEDFEAIVDRETLELVANPEFLQLLLKYKPYRIERVGRYSDAAARNEFSKIIALHFSDSVDVAAFVSDAESVDGVTGASGPLELD